MNKKSFLQSTKDFMLRYGYAIALIVGIVAFTLVLIFATANTEAPLEENRNAIEQVDNKVSVYAPILSASVFKGYNDKNLMYNANLNQWECHKSVDYLVGTNANVYAVMDGKVLEVYNNYLEGNVIVIDHGNGLESVYGSLADGGTLQVGDAVNAGDVIGMASDTAMREGDIGNYLHFAMLDNDKKVDPAGYLNTATK